jgi:hypothetical protein
MTEYVGWLATLVFSASYLCRDKRPLLIIQMIAASIWIGYGLALRSRPVTVANLIVVCSAGISFCRSRFASTRDEHRELRRQGR